jgi:HSP20 family molecular chaperone IbpA
MGLIPWRAQDWSFPNIELPEDTDPEEVRAYYDQSIPEISLPKTERTKSKKVEMNIM